MLTSLATFCYRRRWVVLALWIVALVGIHLHNRATGA